MSNHIAILGWGSLLWDKRLDFEEQIGPWELDGPDLLIEFSRVSKTRGNALTLVVDPTSGSSCRVAHARSRRRDPEDAIRDLRSREQTTRSNIGFYFADGSRAQSRQSATLDAIKAWARGKEIDVVVWTDLEPNFEKIRGRPFSVANAIAHLSALDATAKSGAVDYVRRAPTFVNTPVRAALEAEPWFKQ